MRGSRTLALPFIYRAAPVRPRPSARARPCLEPSVGKRGRRDRSLKSFNVKTASERGAERVPMGVPMGCPSRRARRQGGGVQEKRLGSLPGASRSSPSRKKRQTRGPETKRGCRRIEIPLHASPHEDKESPHRATPAARFRLSGRARPSAPVPVSNRRSARGGGETAP